MGLLHVTGAQRTCSKPLQQIATRGWVAVVQPGRVLFEIAGVPEKLAREAFALASAKLPIHTRVLVRSAAS